MDIIINQRAHSLFIVTLCSTVYYLWHQDHHMRYIGIPSTSFQANKEGAYINQRRCESCVNPNNNWASVLYADADCLYYLQHSEVCKYLEVMDL